jgi:hypothetical protein
MAARFDLIWFGKTEMSSFLYNDFPSINSCAAYIGIGGMRIENEPRHWDEQVVRETQEVQGPPAIAGGSRVYPP